MTENIRRKTLLKRILLTLAALLLLAMAVYVGIQVVLALRSTYRTETAITYTLAESLTLDGVAVFDATEVAGEGSLGYLVADGERVMSGTDLAECYTAEDQGILRERLDRLESTISLLERSQATAGIDLTQLDTQTRQAEYELLDVLDSGVYSTASAAGDAFLLAQNRLQVRTGQSGGFAERLGALYEERDTVQKELGSLRRIEAGTNGYFVCADAAPRLAVDRAALDELDPDAFCRMLADGVPRRGGSCAGEIMGGFSWWFYAACTAEEAEKFDGLSSVRLSVPGKLNEPLKASVLEVRTAEGSDRAIVVLECETINADTLRLGQETARIDLHTYTGIRIDSAAVHIVDGERGVYVNYGGIARFRRITSLYEDENYILVPRDGAVGTDNEVCLYDEIIVEGNNLRDKRLL